MKTIFNYTCGSYAFDSHNCVELASMGEYKLILTLGEMNAMVMLQYPNPNGSGPARLTEILIDVDRTHLTDSGMFPHAFYNLDEYTHLFDVFRVPLKTQNPFAVLDFKAAFDKVTYLIQKDMLLHYRTNP